MLSATLRRATRLARAPRLARGMAEEAAAATGMTLNFTVPASAIYENVPAETSRNSPPTRPVRFDPAPVT